jgi:hypothetical protein
MTYNENAGREARRPRKCDSPSLPNYTSIAFAERRIRHLRRSPPPLPASLRRLLLISRGGAA